MKSAFFLGAQMVVCSLAGYAFQKVFAFYYGASVEKSIFDIAFSVPTMLVYMSGLAHTHSIFVSLFTRLRTQNSAIVDRVFSSLTNASLIIMLILAVAAAVGSQALARVLAPGFNEEQLGAMRVLILWMLPLTATFGISSHLSAVALAWRIPMGQELMLLLARAAVISFVLYKGRAVPLIDVAVVLLVSTLVAIALQWAALLRLTGLRYQWAFDFGDASVMGALQQFLGFVIVAVAAQAAAAYGRRMGTIAGPGVVALLGFAASLVDPMSAIPGRILGFMIGQPLVARMPVFDRKHASPSITHLIVKVLFFGACVAILASVVAVPLVRLLFGGGMFESGDVLTTARYFRQMIVGVPAAIALWVLLYPLLIAGRHTAALMYVSGYLAQIVFIAVSFSTLQGDAVAWGYSVALWTQATIGWAVLTWKTGSAANV